MLVRSHFSQDFGGRKHICPICLEINHQKEHPFLAKKQVMSPHAVFDSKAGENKRALELFPAVQFRAEK